MKKVLSLVTICLLICAIMCGCEDVQNKKEKVDSFLVGGIWEAVVQNNAESEPYVSAYQFKDDGTYVQYRNIIAISGGYFEQNGEKLKLISPDRTQSVEISCTYDESEKVLTLKGKMANQADSPEITIQYKRIDENDEKYYKEDNTLNIEFKKNE